jgi:hypothetical protein
MPRKNPAAVALGRLGGKARAEALSPGRRAEIGRMGGRPRTNAPRCPCGAMTLKRAQSRGRTAEHRPGCEFGR